MNCLDVLADLASVVTALVAVFAYGSYRWMIYQRRKRLETILVGKVSERGATDAGSLTLGQLAAAGNLTEAQVIEATSQSRKIKSYEGTDKAHRFRAR